jgi:hypothetical protein
VFHVPCSIPLSTLTPARAGRGKKVSRELFSITAKKNKKIPGLLSIFGDL